jgi:hypothetical protein
MMCANDVISLGAECYYKPRMPMMCANNVISLGANDVCQ